MKNGIVFDIKRFAIHDGPGIRLTFFLTGCPLSCWWCHNPEALRTAPPDENTCGALLPGQRSLSLLQFLDEIAKEQIFIDESGGGVTFSGGEPLVQIDFLDGALTVCLEREIHTAVDTSGFAPVEDIARIAGKVDLFLYDLKLMDDEAHRRYTGVSNRPIHDNLRYLVKQGRQITIRIPIVPGITGTQENIAATADFLLDIGGIRDVCLLPYHKAASAKYRRLRMEDRMAGMEPPSVEQMQSLQEYLEKRGFVTQIGG